MSRRVLAAHLRALADNCANESAAIPLDSDQAPAEYMDSYDRISSIRASAFRLARRADDLSGGAR